MVTKTIDLQITPIDLESLLAQLTPDTEIILMKGEVGVARLALLDTPYLPKERIGGLHAGTTWVSDDFDEPLPDEYWLGDEATDPLFKKDQ